MKTSKTFNIHFWLKKTAKTKNGQVPIYARITVDGIRADISVKRTVKEEYWCTESRKLNPRISVAKNNNRYLDDVYAKLLDCLKQLHSENKRITAQAIKLRYLGKDKEVSTLKELICYHRDLKVIIEIGIQRRVPFKAPAHSFPKCPDRFHLTPGDVHQGGIPLV